MEKQKRELQMILTKRIDELCMEKDISYYTLSYKSTVPLTTLLHIMDGSTKNPGIYTIMKICDGFGVDMKDFFDTDEFREIITKI